MDQRPKQSETNSSTFPQDSDSDSESEIELRSTHTSPETTTSDELDGTLVDTSMSTTPTLSLSGEGDLDSTEGHSQLSVGTLPLMDKNPPKDPKEKNPPSGPSVEGPTFDFSEDNPGNPPRNVVTVTTPPPEKLEHVRSTPPSPHCYVFFLGFCSPIWYRLSLNKLSPKVLNILVELFVHLLILTRQHLYSYQ